MVSRIEKKLHRQINRYLTLDSDLMNDLSELEGHVRSTPDSNEKILKLLDGLPDFFSSIINVYDQYEDKNKMALHNLDMSSKELNESNRDLEILINSMRAVLESLGPALLFFNEEGICGSFHSKSCLDIFECNPEGKYIWDVLKLKDDDSESLKSLINFSYNNSSAMSCEDIFEMAPQNFAHSKDKHVSLSYKPIMDGHGDISNILVIGVDKTEEINAKNEIKEKEAYSEKIIRIAHAKNDYIQVLQSVEDYFLNDSNATYMNEQSIDSIKENIHTLKGLAGSFQIIEFTNIIHQIEDYIKLSNPKLELLKNKISTHKDHIKCCVSNEIDFSETIFGDNILKQGNSRNVNYDELFNFYKKIEKDNNDISNQFFENFLTSPIFESLSILDFHLIESAKRLNKKVYPCKFEGDNVRIAVRTYDELIMSFVHFIRNAVDHGIESPDKRASLNKNETAQVIIRVKKTIKNNKPWLQISFTDDGRGLDVKKIKRKLESLDMETKNLTDDEILMYVFKEDISTRQTASQISGRGIGLSAVKNNIDRLGGNVSISTKRGSGTTFNVEFPILN